MNVETDLGVGNSFSQVEVVVTLTTPKATGVTSAVAVEVVCITTTTTTGIASNLGRFAHSSEY